MPDRECRSSESREYSVPSGLTPEQCERQVLVPGSEGEYCLGSHCREVSIGCHPQLRITVSYTMLLINFLCDHPLCWLLRYLHISNSFVLVGALSDPAATLQDEWRFQHGLDKYIVSFLCVDSFGTFPYQWLWLDKSCIVRLHCNTTTWRKAGRQVHCSIS